MRMTVIDSLLKSLDTDAPVRSVLVGAHWTVVCTRHCGMAASLTAEGTHGHSHRRAVGAFHLKTAQQLAEYARSDDPMEAGIGIAAINSLLDVDMTHALEINAADVLAQYGRGKKVALVGHFPFVPQLRLVAGQLWVLEQHPIEGDYPAQAASDLLPRADLVAITGSTLVNHTLDGLLGFCRAQAKVMLLGPSTPLSEILFSHGIDILSGARVVDEAAVRRTVEQGASFREVEGVKLLTLMHNTKKE
jgi:uncharacterized protein (DUF4213/DUF364 family)